MVDWVGLNILKKNASSGHDEQAMLDVDRDAHGVSTAIRKVGSNGDMTMGDKK